MTDFGTQYGTRSEGISGKLIGDSYMDSGPSPYQINTEDAQGLATTTEDTQQTLNILRECTGHCTLSEERRATKVIDSLLIGADYLYIAQS